MDLLKDKKIVICGKGGSGKTVFTALAANILNRKGYRVGLLDGDPSNPVGLTEMAIGMKNGPKPLAEFVTKDIGFGQTTSTRTILPEDLKLKLSQIPPRYFLRHENIILFQVGKLPLHHFNNEDFDFTLKHFRIEKAVMLIDNQPGLVYFDNDEQEPADVVLVMVSPEHESVRFAEKVALFSKYRNIDNVWAVLNNIKQENTEKELRTQLASRDIQVIGTVYHDDEIRKAVLQGEMVPHCRAFQQVSKIILRVGTRILSTVFSS